MITINSLSYLSDEERRGQFGAVHQVLVFTRSEVLLTHLAGGDDNVIVLVVYNGDTAVAGTWLVLL